MIINGGSKKSLNFHVDSAFRIIFFFTASFRQTLHARESYELFVTTGVKDAVGDKPVNKLLKLNV